MDHRTTSLADQVFERLEGDILSGKFERGDIVTELQLCQMLGVSRTPVREALRRLETEHLIEDTGKGSRILSITQQDFADMCAIRIRIEYLAVDGFIANMTEESLGELREAVELQEFYLTKNNSDQLKSMDSRFHMCIYKYCGSAILRDTLAPLHKKVQKYRRQSVSNPERAAKSVAEHRAIYNAIEAKDVALAVHLMTTHISNAMNNIIRQMNNN